MAASNYRASSFWHETAPACLGPTQALGSDEQVDVAIVGAGYTGLWTAYYLKTLDPGLRIAIVEAHIAGFGASGRNGGWCLGALAGGESYLSDPTQREGAVRLGRAMFETVDEVGRVARTEDINCHWAKGGTIAVARAEAHRQLLEAELAHLRDLGFGEEDYRWLEPSECSSVIRTRRNLGGLWSPHCAAIHPMRLARGLAEACQRRGVSLYEHTPALSLEPNAVVTANGRLRADVVVCATEAYSDSLPSRRRRLLPLHSMMIATEPLPDSVWSEIGLENRPTFYDPRRSVIYGQRTADDRIAFGGRGAYFYGSSVRDRFAADDEMFASVKHSLEHLFPVLRSFEITHRWGGALAVPRNWQPAVGIDRKSGFAWGGGYVGEGVAATNLAGRTLADLILQRDTELVTLPWVGAQFPRWEPEPLRWLAVSLVRKLGNSIDRSELAGRPTPRLRSAVYDAIVSK